MHALPPPQGQQIEIQNQTGHAVMIASTGQHQQCASPTSQLAPCIGCAYPWITTGWTVLADHEHTRIDNRGSPYTLVMILNGDGTDYLAHHGHGGGVRTSHYAYPAARFELRQSQEGAYWTAEAAIGDGSPHTVVQNNTAAAMDQALKASGARPYAAWMWDHDATVTLH